jgi:hypothetical protein
MAAWPVHVGVEPRVEAQSNARSCRSVRAGWPRPLSQLRHGVDTSGKFDTYDRARIRRASTVAVVTCGYV